MRNTNPIILAKRLHAVIFPDTHTLAEYFSQCADTEYVSNLYLNTIKNSSAKNY